MADEQDSQNEERTEIFQSDEDFLDLKAEQVPDLTQENNQVQSDVFASINTEVLPASSAPQPDSKNQKQEADIPSSSQNGTLSQDGVALLDPHGKAQASDIFQASAHINFLVSDAISEEIDDSTQIFDPQQTSKPIEARVEQKKDESEQAHASLAGQENPLRQDSSNEEIESCETIKEMPAVNVDAPQTIELKTALFNDVLIEKSDDIPDSVHAPSQMQEEHQPSAPRPTDVPTSNPASNSAASPTIHENKPTSTADDSASHHRVPTGIQQALDGIDLEEILAASSDQEERHDDGLQDKHPHEKIEEQTGYEEPLGSTTTEKSETSALQQTGSETKAVKPNASSNRRYLTFSVIVIISAVLATGIVFYVVSSPSLSSPKKEISSVSPSDESDSPLATADPTTSQGSQEDGIRADQTPKPTQTETKKKSSKKQKSAKRQDDRRTKRSRSKASPPKKGTVEYRVVKTEDNSNARLNKTVLALQRSFHNLLANRTDISARKSRSISKKGYSLRLYIKSIKSSFKEGELLIKTTCSMIVSQGSKGGIRLSSEAVTGAARTTSSPENVKASLARDALEACGKELGKDFIAFAKKKIK